MRIEDFKHVKTEAKKIAKDGSDESEWESESISSTDSEEIDLEGKQMEELRRYFLK